MFRYVSIKIQVKAQPAEQERCTYVSSVCIFVYLFYTGLLLSNDFTIGINTIGKKYTVFVSTVCNSSSLP